MVANWRFNIGEITVRPQKISLKISCYTSFSWKFFAEFKSVKRFLNYKISKKL